jgi:hypothetical protein
MSVFIDSLHGKAKYPVTEERTLNVRFEPSPTVETVGFRVGGSTLHDFSKTSTCSTVSARENR